GSCVRPRTTSRGSRWGRACARPGSGTAVRPGGGSPPAPLGRLVEVAAFDRGHERRPLLRCRVHGPGAAGAVDPDAFGGEGDAQAVSAVTARHHRARGHRPAPCSNTRTGIPAAFARRTQSMVPTDVPNGNAATRPWRTLVSTSTIRWLRRGPAARPCRSQSAGY